MANPYVMQLAYRPAKRERAVSDVDGEGSANTQSKKRRLRLDLITSRLSEPYATPPTYIVSRGASKISIWARQKAFGRNLLRKVAILNSLRLRSEYMKDAERKRLELDRLHYLYGGAGYLYGGVSGGHLEPRDDESRIRQSSPGQGPHRQFIPLPSSPLGLSNYDAFDEEVDPFGWSLNDESDARPVDDDVTTLEPSEPVVDDYDSIARFEDNTAEHGILGHEQSHTRSSDNTVTEGERQRMCSFLRFGP